MGMVLLSSAWIVLASVKRNRDMQESRRGASPAVEGVEGGVEKIVEEGVGERMKMREKKREREREKKRAGRGEEGPVRQ